MINSDPLVVFLGGICTLAIFSFLVRENPVYRFFEHTFIGIATGVGIVLGIKNFLWPVILVPLFGLDIVAYPDGTFSKTYNYSNLLFIFSLIFGLFYYAIYSPRFNWLAKLSIGISLGAGAGLYFKGFFQEMLPQLQSSIVPLVVFSEEGAFQPFATFSNWVFVITLLSAMYYFFFTFKRAGRGSEAISVTGRWLMMVCFGAFFGSTVMARMAILVERLQFMISQWSVLVWSAVW